MDGKLNRADKETEERLDSCPRWPYRGGAWGATQLCGLLFPGFSGVQGGLAARGLGGGGGLVRAERGDAGRQTDKESDSTEID